MIISVEETPSKCNHIIITTDTGELITTTKDMLITPIVLEKSVEELVIEQVQTDIKTLGTTDWTAISDMYKVKVIK